MMGHTGLIPLDKNYFREHAYELIEEYLKAVPALTISDEERIKLKVVELGRENQEKDQKYAYLETRIKELENSEHVTLQKIEKGFSLIQNTTQIVNSTLQNLQTMKMSILKQAFEGKLVPQDPNDEPASVLLERIKSTKESQSTKQRGMKNVK